MGMREPGRTRRRAAWLRVAWFPAVWFRAAWFRARAARPGGDLRAAGPDGRGGIASRPSGWPVLRTPTWMLAAGAVLVAGLALAAVPHRPSTEQRAADLRGMVQDLTTDIESCAGGVSDSVTALRAIQSGASNDVKTAVTIANTA